MQIDDFMKTSRISGQPIRLDDIYFQVLITPATRLDDIYFQVLIAPATVYIVPI